MKDFEFFSRNSLLKSRALGSGPSAQPKAARAPSKRISRVNVADSVSLPSFWGRSSRRRRKRQRQELNQGWLLAPGNFRPRRMERSISRFLPSRQQMGNGNNNNFYRTHMGQNAYSQQMRLVKGKLCREIGRGGWRPVGRYKSG